MATPSSAPPRKINGGVKDGLITFQTSHGVGLRGTVHRLRRHQILFETYSPEPVLQMSEVLSNFTFLLEDRAVYSGKAVVTNVVHTGLCTVCEVRLEEEWTDGSIFVGAANGAEVESNFGRFMQHWGKTYRILPEFKVVMADIQSFLMDLRSWLEQVELGIRSSPAGSRSDLERELMEALTPHTTAAIGSLFDEFENVARTVDPEFAPAHQAFGARQLHPLILAAPFVYRTLQKPLGHAGDYEMVNMIMRDPYEGASLFAKAFNVCALSRPPIVAHRNRLRYLADKLFQETARNLSHSRTLKVLNVGCGPAHEVQMFMREHDCSDQAEFTLVDFDAESLEYVGRTLSECKNRYARSTRYQAHRWSVQQMLRQSMKPVVNQADQRYDFIYSAGLFDYFPDTVCKSLLRHFYDLLAPGGAVLTTNVDNHSSRHEMEYFLDWHLLYRNTQAMLGLVPPGIRVEDISVMREHSGINVFLEIRKPERE